MIIPDSEIYLIDCPISLDNKNQLTFNNSNEQYNYFINLSKFHFSELSYIRKDNYIRAELNADNLNNINYLMFKNTSYTNKWFYAFITNVVYVTDIVCHIYFEVDVFQSWQFDIIYKQSFIEREHINVSEDTPRK